MTLLLKLVLVPGLIALVTVAGRRFGPRIGGWLNALPLVAGPVLFFLALEQGDAFVARAAEATLAGLAAVAAFSVIYAWTAVTRSWWVCVLVGWTAFALLTVALQAVTWTAASGLALAVHLLVHGAVWLGWGALASRGSARRGPRAARRSA